ncbi:hypothetical protein ACWOE5_07755 [Aerococcus sanguinicola]|uniref:Uncharacterized protein n=1 Tax=Aerococcus sanguinicola TaxID=119206 RepID=A0A109RD46_9LACT|nr:MULTISPECIES: hypothetical protein [Aerococcus]AMB93956.1 hypothetical protein AWM72_03865 [Aerococcus sanguinicola]MDK7050591.1 hypothetical protein [Aerococcus sanguinicola]OFT97382.1 hypothetical protein HMPREF3090_00960 [Aerococcus sp. HMSC23C02]PKZ21094.1 hypothetical protein CYJ28_07870 [Aerococcus sanguinicola]
MDLKQSFTESLEDLVQSLEANHPEARTTRFVRESLDEVKEAEGVALTGQIQQFLEKAPIVKSSEKLEFSAEEKELWRKLLDHKQLGNNLWGLSL